MDPDRRKTHRHHTKNLIAVTSNGVAQVSNITLSSVFFRCVEKIDFPDHWLMDLYDPMKLDLVEVLVKKIWVKTTTEPNKPKSFHSEVAAQFENLSPYQKDQLKYYLSQQNECGNGYFNFEPG